MSRHSGTPIWTKFRYLSLPMLGILTLLFSARLASPQAPEPQAPKVSVQASEQSPPPGAQAGQPAPAGEQQPLLKVVEGRLTLKVRNVRLGWILDQLTQKAKVAIVVGTGAGSELATMDLEDTPLEKALREILRHHDAFFFYGPDKDDSAVLQVVWVYPKGKGRALQPVPPEEWASTRELEAALADTNAETRLNATMALIERGSSDRAMQVALRATSDADENVRATALFAAGNKGLKLPRNLLVNLLSIDTSESVRLLALTALARDPSARPYAEMALKDPSLPVQQKAQEILKQLEAAESHGPAQHPPAGVR